MTEYLIEKDEPNIKKQTEDTTYPMSYFICGAFMGSIYNYQWYITGMKYYKFFNNISPSTIYIRESLALKETTIVGAVSGAFIATALNTEYFQFETAAINFLLMTAESTLYFMSEATGSNALEYSSAALLLGHAVYNADIIFDMLELV